MIVIVDTGGANIASVIFALERLGAKVQLSADPEHIQNASHVIWPGVGTATDSMYRLQQLKLHNVMRNLTQPTLGICLGMQLLYEFSAEGNVDCLGVIPGKVEHLSASPGITIPHMGWNQLEISTDSPLLKNVPNNSYVYFVHSYAAPITATTCAVTRHGSPFTAVCQQDNFFGTQFHPERSGEVGATILRNFLELNS